MKLSMHTSSYTHNFIPELGDLIDYCADLGYQALDLSLDGNNPTFTEYKLVNDENWEYPARRIRAKMKARGLVFCQAHAPMVAYAPASKEDERKMVRCIEVCHFFGIHSLVVHPLHIKGCDRESFVRENVAYFKRFLPLLDQYDVDFCFENLGHNLEVDLYCFSAADLLKLINAFGHPHIHACWDTGHGNLTRQKQYESVVQLGDHLRAVHVQDNHYPISEPDGIFCSDFHLIPLFGNVNFDGFIQGLIDIGYKGGFSLESDIPNRRGHQDFNYKGNSQMFLKPIPFRIRRMADEIQVEVGKYMLSTYGLWEGK